MLAKHKSYESVCQQVYIFMIDLEFQFEIGVSFESIRKSCSNQRDGRHGGPQGQREQGGLGYMRMMHENDAREWCTRMMHVNDAWNWEWCMRMVIHEAKQYMRISTVVVVYHTGVVDGMMGHRGGVDEGGCNWIAMSLVMSSLPETVMCMKLLIGCLG